MKTNIIISIKRASVESSLITPRQDGVPPCREGTFY